jgi:hypothetical protein
LGISHIACLMAPGVEPPLEDPKQLLVGGRSVVILVAR